MRLPQAYRRARVAEEVRVAAEKVKRALAPLHGQGLFAKEQDDWPENLIAPLWSVFPKNSFFRNPKQAVDPPRTHERVF